MKSCGLWTGRETAAFRQAFAVGREAFAAKTGVSVEAVKKWERRGATIRLSPPFAERMDRELARADAAVVERFWSILAGARPTQVGHSGGTVALVAANEEEYMRRRTFGTLAVAAAAAPGFTSVRVEAADVARCSRVAPELVDYFRTQLTGHYTADMRLGPHYLIPTVESQTELITVLVGVADGPVRRGLLETSTAYAALLGWLYQDAGNLPASAKWRDTTLSLAHRSGDPQMISYALSNLAMLALDQGDGRAVIDYAKAALVAGRQLSAKARVIALQHEAHGYAMLGDRTTADRLLDKVATLIRRVDDAHPWGNSCRRTPHHLEVQRATCYGRTGSIRDARDAAGLWDEIIDSMPESARRDNAVFRARQSTALARIPDPDRAVWAAAEAAEAVAVTGSARLRSELKEIPSHARAWENSSAGRELCSVIGAIA